MLKSGSAKTAIIVSSVTFGAGHIVNLLTGHGAPETLLQVAFAIAIGFLFTMVYYKGGSLLPLIVSHSLIDVFSVFSARSSLGVWIYMGVVLVLSVSYCLYLRRLETAPIHRS